MELDSLSTMFVLVSIGAVCVTTLAILSIIERLKNRRQAVEEAIEKRVENAIEEAVKEHEEAIKEIRLHDHARFEERRSRDDERRKDHDRIRKDECIETLNTLLDEYHEGNDKFVMEKLCLSSRELMLIKTGETECDGFALVVLYKILAKNTDLPDGYIKEIDADKYIRFMTGSHSHVTSAGLHLDPNWFT